MTTDRQVRRLMLLMKDGVRLSQAQVPRHAGGPYSRRGTVTAARKAGMSEPTARKYRRAGKLPLS